MRRLAVIGLLILVMAFTAEGQVLAPLTAGVPVSCVSKALRQISNPSLRIPAYADPSIDVTYYRLNLHVSTSPSFLSGSVVMQARSVVDSLRSIVLDLTNVMTVDSVLAGGRTVPFAQFQAIVSVTLDRSYASNEILRVEVFYHGTPAGTGFGSFEFSQHGPAQVPWVWSLSEPYGARDWWPCKDHPSDKADSVDVLVTADALLKVGSNGRLVSVVSNGDGTNTTHWAERYPIATYLVSVALTDFSEFTSWFRYAPGDSMPVLNYVLPEHLSSAEQNLSKVPSMLAIFSSRYGLYPFIEEKYGHCEFGWGGAMEHQTMTSTTSFDEYVVAHELAHQWFGDLITCADWKSIWLDEGFASYSEAVYGEGMYGPAAYRASIGTRMGLALTATGSLYVEDTSSVRSLFDNRLVYSKGASVLHMLRHILGDTVFFRAMRAYAGDPGLRFGVATTEDFQRNCETVSGLDLGYFFQQWIYGNGHPKYGLRWTSEAASPGYLVHVTVDQIATGTGPAFFTMPVDLEFRSASYDSTLSVFHTVNGQNFTFHLPQRPDTVIVDPGEWILREIYSPGGLAPASYVLEQNFPNPFNAGTSIRYTLPRRSQISLKVYDIVGREVTTLLEGKGEPGSWDATWDGRDRKGKPVASGVYLYRLNVEGFSSTRNMVIIR